MMRAPGFTSVFLIVTALGAGCRTPPPQSAATIRASELPADPAELLRRLDELSQSHDRVALENALVVADKLLGQQPGDYDAAWRGARAAFWLADEATADKGRRAFFAEKGIAYADQAVKAKERGIEGVYYRALNRGYLAQTKTVGALALLSPLAADAKAAVEIDEKYDGAGPHRAWGMLLLKAPKWPSGIGDPDEAMEQLAKAVELAPEHPLNHLYYGETLLANDKPADAKREIDEAVKVAGAPGWEFLRARLEAQAKELGAQADAKLK